MSFDELKEDPIPESDPRWRDLTNEEVDSLIRSLVGESVKHLRDHRRNRIRAVFVSGVAPSTAPEAYVTASEEGGAAGWAPSVALPLQLAMSECEIPSASSWDDLHADVMEHRPRYLMIILEIWRVSATVPYPIVVCDTLSPDGQYLRNVLLCHPNGGQWLGKESHPTDPPPFFYWRRHDQPELPLAEAKGAILSSLAYVGKQFREHGVFSQEMHAVGRGRCVLAFERAPFDAEQMAQLKDPGFNAVSTLLLGPNDLQRASDSGCTYVLGFFTAALGGGATYPEAHGRVAGFDGLHPPAGSEARLVALLYRPSTLAIETILVWDPALALQPERPPVEEWEEIPLPAGARLHLGEKGAYVDVSLNTETGETRDCTPPGMAARGVAEA